MHIGLGWSTATFCRVVKLGEQYSITQLYEIGLCSRFPGRSVASFKEWQRLGNKWAVQRMAMGL